MVRSQAHDCATKFPLYGDSNIWPELEAGEACEIAARMRQVRHEALAHRVCRYPIEEPIRGTSLGGHSLICFCEKLVSGREEFEARAKVKVSGSTTKTGAGHTRQMFHIARSKMMTTAARGSGNARSADAVSRSS